MGGIEELLEECTETELREDMVVMIKAKGLLLILACCVVPYLCIAQRKMMSFYNYDTKMTFSSAFVISEEMSFSSNVVGKVYFSSRSPSGNPTPILISKEEIYELVAFLDGSYLASVNRSGLRAAGMSRMNPIPPSIHLHIYNNGKCLYYLDFYSAKTRVYFFHSRRRVNQCSRMYRIKNERLDKVRSIISNWEGVLTTNEVMKCER